MHAPTGRDHTSVVPGMQQESDTVAGAVGLSRTTIYAGLCEWQPTGVPEAVRVYDFIDPELGKVAPYGVYDVGANQGWVSVGITHDTAEFAVESIRRWWREMGQPLYPAARRLLITADCGGSNGYRVRLWKVALQRLADDLGMIIPVCHLPPGTSKWNKIEHRMFKLFLLESLAFWFGVRLDGQLRRGRGRRPHL